MKIINYFLNSTLFMRMFMLTLLVSFWVGVSFGQDGPGINQGVAGLTEAASQLQDYIAPVTKLCYIIAALIGLIGAVVIAIAFNNHDQDVQKKVAMTVGGIIFMLVAAQVIPLFFGFVAS